MLERVSALTGARAARITERVQSLWSGYGEIVRVALDGGIAPTAIVKHVQPPATRNSISDARKRRSYDVEQRFYRDFAPRCEVRVAALYGSDVAAGEWLFVLEDLDAAGFVDRHDDARGSALEACLAWLAGFHARFLGDPGEGLWPVGTYWHLETRRDELSAIKDRYLRSHADEIDARLSAARFQTILHGDPKEANFCFGRDRVAAVDFQYAGRGCAMRDVAYLLHGHGDARAHLDTYFGHLSTALAPELAAAVEAEWRGLYDDARLDFERFLAGWQRG
jgi:aminoglycoside/choline kinase family phosphotransferase